MPSKAAKAKHKEKFQSAVSPTEVYESGIRLIESGEITSPISLWCIKAIITLAMNASANYKKRNDLTKRINALESKVLTLQMKV